MYVKKAKPGEKFRIPIHRQTEEQLDLAIKDLEKRGFVCIKRGLRESEVVCYSSTNKRNSKYEYTGTTKQKRAWAILEK